ncbi:phosphodiester glycosidase family protein [Pseudomonadota bacterium]
MVKIDPTKYEFEIYQNKNKKDAKNIKEIHTETNSLLTFNGAYFTEDFKPTGLLINKGHIIKNLTGAELTNGILTINRSGVPFILSNTVNFDPKNFDFAIQNGPILIDNGGEIQISDENKKTASRTVIGVDKNNHLVVIILKRSLLNATNAISLYDMAKIIKDSSQIGQLGLKSVLNLDGGSSTGLAIDDTYFAEMEKVQNVIITKWKN